MDQSKPKLNLKQNVSLMTMLKINKFEWKTLINILL